MFIYHNSNTKFAFPSHESIIKNRTGHVNGVLGLWFANNTKWNDSFGVYTYEIEIHDSSVSLISVNDLMSWEKNISKQYINENDKEKAYLELREKLLKNYSVLQIQELDGRYEMGIILNFDSIVKFSLKEKYIKNKIKF